MHDFGDLGRALEMVALLPGVALGGYGIVLTQGLSFVFMNTLYLARRLRYRARPFYNDATRVPPRLAPTHPTRRKPRTNTLQR